MKTIRYSIIILVMVSVAAFTGCKEKKLVNNVNAAETHAHGGEGEEEENHEGHAHAEGGHEAEGEHEELPEDIVELDIDQIKYADIQLGQVEMRQVNGQTKANGIVSTTPQNSASVSVPLGGFVKSSNLLPGNAVKKGQPLAIIENTEFVDMQQNYLDIKNKFEYAEAEYKRHNELYKQDVYSEKSMQQTTTEYKSLKSQLRGIEQKLLVIGINPSTLTEDDISATITLKSPINGYIKTANISMGKYVSSTDVLFEIVGNDNLLLELTLFEKDANTISIGQVVRFNINNE